MVSLQFVYFILSCMQLSIKTSTYLTTFMCLLESQGLRSSTYPLFRESSLLKKSQLRPLGGMQNIFPSFQLLVKKGRKFYVLYRKLTFSFRSGRPKKSSSIYVVLKNEHCMQPSKSSQEFKLVIRRFVEGCGV